MSAQNLEKSCSESETNAHHSSWFPEEGIVPPRFHQYRKAEYENASRNPPYHG